MAKLGRNAKLGYATGGIGAVGTATYVEATNVEDVTYNASREEINVTTRETQGYEARAGGLASGELTFNMLWDPSDPFFAAVQSAWQNGTSIGMAIVDEAFATGNGFEADMSVLGFEITQPLREAQKVAVTMSVTDSVNAPRYVTGGVGA